MDKSLPTHTKPGSSSSKFGLWEAAEELYAKYKIPCILLYYGLCSSTLIVINKLAVHTVSAPVFILLLQLLFAAAVVKGCAVAGWLEAEKLQWSLVRPFLLIIVGFLGTLYANIQVLSFSNVETFITFRSSTPLVLSIFDYLFLGRELPGGRSIFSLLMLLTSCAGYTYFDQGFKLQAYTWLLIWYAFFTFEACWVKHMCDTVKMSNWGRVYYTNILAGTFLALVFPFCDHEHQAIAAAGWSVPQIFTLVLSCAVGVGMSHAGYLMRSNVSATAGVVVGVVCKIGSVLINLLIWDQHANTNQLIFLGLGLAGGSLFRQAPLRSAAAANKAPNSADAASEEEGLIKVGTEAGSSNESDDGSTCGSNATSNSGNGSSSGSSNSLIGGKRR